MPEQPNRKVLDREFAKAGSKELIDLACPLLREVVNHATNAHIRCQVDAAATGQVDAHLAPFALYRTVFEMIDAIEELLSVSCVLPAIPLVRTAFEAGLGLDYVTEADGHRRSLAWVYAYAEKRLRTYRMIAGQGQPGVEFLKSFTQQFGKQLPQHPQINDAIKGMETLLNKPHMAEIDAEFKRLNTGKRVPNWHRLFDGPADLRLLAKSQGRLAEYDFLYRYWSGIAHAHHLGHIISRLDGGPADKGLRAGDQLLEVARVAVGIQLRATRVILRLYRPGEKLDQWYLRDVKPAFDRLMNTTVTTNVLEL